MNEKHLDHTGAELDLPRNGPEYPEECDHWGQGHAHVSERKHGQEEVHGLVQPGVCPDNVQDGAVARYSNKVEETEGDGNPVVKFLISRDTCEVERGGKRAADV